jgi:hypothetical protein
MAGVVTHLKRLKNGCLDTLFSRFACWTKPFRTSLPMATFADLSRSKSELIAENALLRQQLIVLRRQVKRPTFSRTDRMLLVLLARLVRTWQQALDCSTRYPAALASSALPPVLEAQVKGSCSQAKGRPRDHRLDQRDGEGESTLGCRADSRRTPETRHSCLQTNHSEVHEEGSHLPTTRSDVGDRSRALTPHRSGRVTSYRSPICSFDRSLPSSSSS